MSKVFITHSSSHIDYSPATRFGTINIVFDHHTGPYGFRNVDSREEMIDTAAEAAKSFNPKEDFLLMSGNPIIMGLVFHMFYKKEEYARCLQWDRYASKYIIFEIAGGRK